MDTSGSYDNKRWITHISHIIPFVLILKNIFINMYKIFAISSALALLKWKLFVFFTNIFLLIFCEIQSILLVHMKTKSLTYTHIWILYFFFFFSLIQQNPNARTKPGFILLCQLFLFFDDKMDKTFLFVCQKRLMRSFLYWIKTFMNVHVKIFTQTCSY